MKNKIKRILIFILLVSLQFGIQYGTNQYKKLADHINIDLHRQFDYFGDELENINDFIAKILISNPKEYEIVMKENMINGPILWNFRISNEYAFNKKGVNIQDKYLDIIYDSNNSIQHILKDHHIDKEEEKYLNTLFAYNEELIHLHKKLNINNEIKKVKNRYIDFSKKADEILKDERYSILKDDEIEKERIEEVENSIDLKTAQKITQEIVDEVLPVKVELSFDEKSQNDPTKYQFDRIYIREHTYYRVEYDKKYNRVSMDLGSYTGDPINLSEEKLNKIAKKIISKFDDGSYIKMKEDINGLYESKDIVEKEYYYIKKIGDIYDETKIFGLRLIENGDIDSFYIEGIMIDENIPTPKYNKDQILSKIPQKDFIKKCILIRTKEGKLKYEVQMNINGVLYSKVFDGDTGKEKYFGRNIRLYE
ncbi:hypothetical protein [Anaerophilus nitritogenes]|uniref:hypothetical protein n=1 Tax=Anaerophilus nitritogenes TaxID=2498136 RepID=UPI00101DDF0C|nr:hypothetical protein [Anaerophilus nitritogenes]